jgi:hypothetical protein
VAARGRFGRNGSEPPVSDERVGARSFASRGFPTVENSRGPPPAAKSDGTRGLSPQKARRRSARPVGAPSDGRDWRRFDPSRYPVTCDQTPVAFVINESIRRTHCVLLTFLSRGTVPGAPDSADRTRTPLRLYSCNRRPPGPAVSVAWRRKRRASTLRPYDCNHPPYCGHLVGVAHTRPGPASRCRGRSPPTGLSPSNAPVVGSGTFPASPPERGCGGSSDMYFEQRVTAAIVSISGASGTFAGRYSISYRFRYRRNVVRTVRPRQEC